MLESPNPPQRYKRLELFERKKIGEKVFFRESCATTSLILKEGSCFPSGPLVLCREIWGSWLVWSAVAGKQGMAFEYWALICGPSAAELADLAALSGPLLGQRTYACFGGSEGVSWHEPHLKSSQDDHPKPTGGAFEHKDRGENMQNWRKLNE